MNYLRSKTVANLTLAGVFIVVGYCLQLAGMATIASRMVQALQSLLLVNYEWHLNMAVMIQMIYLADIWWWDTVAHVYTGWAVFGLTIIGGLHRFVSTRLSALATIAFLVGTFILGAPSFLSEQFVSSAGGHVYQSETATDDKTSEVSDAPKRPSVTEFWSTSDTGLSLGQIASGLSWAASLYNVVRLVLIPFITVSLSVYLIASLRRARD